MFPMEKKDRKGWGVIISIHARLISHFLVNLLPLFGETSPIFTIAKRVQSKIFKLDLVSQFSTNSIFFKFSKGGTLQNLQRGVVPSWPFQSSTIFSWVSINGGVHDLRLLRRMMNINWRCFFQSNGGPA